MLKDITKYPTQKSTIKYNKYEHISYIKSTLSFWIIRETDKTGNLIFYNDSNGKIKYFEKE